MATGAMAHAGTSATAYQRDLELAPQRSAGNTTETLEALICGPGNFRIEDMEPAEIQKQLFSKYKIYTI